MLEVLEEDEDDARVSPLRRGQPPPIPSPAPGSPRQKKEGGNPDATDRRGGRSNGFDINLINLFSLASTVPCREV